MGEQGNTYLSSSSMDSSSSSNPSLISSASVPETRRKDLSTDLRLGLSIPSFSSSHHLNSSSARSTLRERGKHQNCATLFVKVNMEGVGIGRKLDLYAQQGYDGLIRTLSRMFKATITSPDPDVAHMSSRRTRVLTYEDKEGDWMMVGDVPWELFLTTVRRLKIIRASKC